MVSGRRHALANARTYVPDNTMRQLLLLFTSCATCSAAAPTMDCIRLALDGPACPAGTVLAAVSKPGLRIVGRSFAAAAAAAREFCGVAREAASFRIGEAHLKSGLRSSGHKLKLMFPRASSGIFFRWAGLSVASASVRWYQFVRHGFGAPFWVGAAARCKLSRNRWTPLIRLDTPWHSDSLMGAKLPQMQQLWHSYRVEPLF